MEKEFYAEETETNSGKLIIFQKFFALKYELSLVIAEEYHIFLGVERHLFFFMKSYEQKSKARLCK